LELGLGGRIMLNVSFEKYDVFCGPDLLGSGQRSMAKFK
jgi:hypothetical protein